MEVNFGTLVIIIHRASCRGITENILQLDGLHKNLPKHISACVNWLIDVNST